MPDASYQITSFLGGEWSQSAQGAMDDPIYRTALNANLNGMMLETGAWTRRPGMMFAGRTPSGAPARVIPFNFTSVVPYTLELSDRRIRFYNGATLVTTNTQLTVLSISAANPAVVRTLQPHGLTSGRYVEFINLGAAMPLLQKRVLDVVVIDPNNFSIFDDITGGIDGSTLGAMPAGLTVSPVLQIDTTYIRGTSNDWSNIRPIQAETETILLNGRPPNILTALTQPTPSQSATFDFRALNFIDGPYLDPFNGNTNIIGNSSIVLQPTAVGGGVIQLGASTLVGGAPPNIFAATDVGRQMRLYSAPPTWQSSSTYGHGTLVLWNGQVFSNTSTGPSTGVQPDTDGSIWTIQGGVRAFWVYGVIVSVINTGAVTFQVLGPGNNQLLYATPVEFWRLGVYSDTTGWPTCGCYHEGRVWLGGAVSNRFDASMSNGLTPVIGNPGPTLSMSPTDWIGAVSDSNGISYVLNAKDVNEMLWMEPDEQGILCGTKGGEWVIKATTANLPLSPTNIQAHRYTTVGCANIEPRRTPLTLAFIQKYGRKIMEFFPDVYSGRFTAPNLTKRAKHLTVGGLVELAYQQELSPTLWARRADGALLGCTYKRENLMAREEPTFAGWHRHQLGSGRIVESICTSGNATGTLDTLVAVTNDPATNIRWFEVLSDIPDEDDGLTQAWLLDGSVAPSSYQLNSVGDVPVSLQLNGLWHLNGKTVTIWAGGLDVGDYLVTNGSLTIPFGDGVNSGPNGTSDLTGPWNPGGGAYLFTAAFVNSFGGAMPIVVGFTYSSQGQHVRPNSREDSGARNGPAFGKKKLANMIALLAVNSQGISYGTNFNAMQPAYFADITGAKITVNVLFSGVFWDSISDDWSFDAMIAWQITRPYPATVASLGGFMKTNDY
jgi:hypothetical protein